MPARKVTVKTSDSNSKNRIHVKESNRVLFQLNHYRILHHPLMILVAQSIQKNAALQAHNKPFRLCHFIVQNT